MGLQKFLYKMYARRLRKALNGKDVPSHVALVIDGNRRWAQAAGFTNISIGHRYGAEHVETVLGWCAELGIAHVTVYIASRDNLRKRDSAEVEHLLSTVEEVIAGRLVSGSNPWRLHVAGRLEYLPDATAQALKNAMDATEDREGLHVTIAIGYDGHEEITDAVRVLIEREAAAGVDIVGLAQRLTPSDIATHLRGHELPQPELIIRTSGENRLSGFLLWQSAGAQLYFCDVYWPGFRHVDFLRALRSFAARQER